ncbi:MAG TPA: peptidylprolyl isomerase [Cryptosporangiaceae bacterium]|nr:peptidylprolyl isomerase [Cryptosporangiaceae bacterium]
MPPSKERQRQIARAKLERQMARRAAAARRRRRVQAGIGAALGLLAVVAGTVFLVAKFGGDDDKAASADAPKCTYSPPAAGTFDPKTVKDVGVPPTTDIPTTGTRTVSLKTSVGLIEIALDQAAAPCTAHSFVYLAGKGFYDGSSCHRMTTGPAKDPKALKVLQCGDPSGTGTGGPAYKYGAENLPTQTVTLEQGKVATYTRGTVAMANSGPDTTGSQFFIVYGDSQLPPNYNIVGEVTSGLEVVDKVAKAGVTPRDPKNPNDGTPKLKVTLQNVTVEPTNNG